MSSLRGKTLALEVAAIGSPGPADHGWAAWAYDPAIPVNNTVMTAGTVSLSGNFLRAPRLISTLWCGVNTVGSGLTAGQNFVGLYGADGTLLGSASADTAFTGAGTRSVTLATPVACPAGMYWVALLANGTTPPALIRSGGVAIWNGNLSAAASRFATNGTGRTSLISITPSANAIGQAYWTAMS